MHRVALHAERHRLDQRRAAALARVLDRPLRLAVDGEHVGAVDDDALEAVRGGAVGDVLDRVARGSVGVEYAHWLLSQTKTTGSRRTPAKFMPSCASPRAAAPSPNQATATRRSCRIRKASAMPDGDGEHRRQVADHRVEAERRLGHVDVAVAPAGRAVLAAHVLREDPPRLDAARDVDAHVALERRADVVRAHRRRDADGGRLVAAARVERARESCPACRGCGRAPRCRA